MTSIKMGSVGNNPIILYDGRCGLCNRFNQFVLQRDASKLFRFAALQGLLASRILMSHQENTTEISTIYIVLNHGTPEERLLSKSDAVHFVLEGIGWKHAAWLIAKLPNWLRDQLYDIVSSNRYRLFGKSDSCFLPNGDQRTRFLDLGILPDGPSGSQEEMPS